VRRRPGRSSGRKGNKEKKVITIWGLLFRKLLGNSVEGQRGGERRTGTDKGDGEKGIVCHPLGYRSKRNTLGKPFTAYAGGDAPGRSKDWAD